MPTRIACGVVDYQNNMENFIKENWFKLSIVIIIIISIFQYFNLAIKKQDTQNILNCKKTAEEYTEKLALKKLNYLEPKYIYNKEMNACVYMSHEIFHGFGGGYTETITNLDTNDQIISSSYTGYETGKLELFMGVTKEEFDLKEKELFGE